MTDQDGKLRIATTSDGVNTSLLYRKSESDEFEAILTTNFKETVDPLFFSFDNTYLYEPQKCDYPWKVHRIRDITKRILETDDEPHHLWMM